MARGIMACSPSEGGCKKNKKCSECKCEDVFERIRYFYEVLMEIEDEMSPFDEIAKIALKDHFEKMFQDVIFED